MPTRKRIPMSSSWIFQFDNKRHGIQNIHYTSSAFILSPYFFATPLPLFQLIFYFSFLLYYALQLTPTLLPHFLIHNLRVYMKQAKLKQIQSNYDCVICMDLSKKPVSCLRCHKLVCYHHLRLLGGKCPHCRLQPFQYQAESLIQSFIQIEIRKKREEQKKQKIFKCLVEGCKFQGKYPAMLFHKKSKHANESLDEILFEDQRQKKRMREALKRIFLQKYMEKTKKYTQDALLVYVKTRGAVQLKKLITMVAHADTCPHEHCKEVFFQQNNVFIGYIQDQVKIQSQCPQGALMRVMI